MKQAQIPNYWYQVYSFIGSVFRAVVRCVDSNIHMGPPAGPPGMSVYQLQL